MVQMLAMFGEFERATIIDRVINGMERQAARGEWPGGYRPHGANLVATRKEGTKIYYRLAGTDVAALSALTRTVAGEHLAEVASARAAYLGPDTDQVTREELLRRVGSGQRR